MATDLKSPDTTITRQDAVPPSPTDHDGRDETSRDDSEPRVKPSKWRRVAGFFWDSVDGDERDRRYIQKLHIYLFWYICLGYFIKYLDQTNYVNAFVSGMQEDLSLYGNERNLLNTYFNIGIIVGTVPSMMVQIRFVRPSIWIPACELVWSALVMVMASAKKVETLYALRFLVGLLESCAFPGYAALLGGWYGPKQLSKRMAIFEQTSAISSMFSSYLQAALYTGMNGTLGFAGWRWLFIFDGIISVPIALWGFFAIPDLPHTTRAFYWTKEDKEYGIKRIEDLGQKPPERLSLAAIKKVYTNWRLWAFILPYLMVAQSGSGTSYFNLWLKWAGYSVVDTNVLPTAGNVLSIVSAFVFGMIADFTGQRLSMIIVVQLLVMLSNILLSIWNIPTGALFFAFYLSYIGAAAQPIVIAWGNELNRNDPNLKQLLVATGNIFTYGFSSWLPLALFPTYDAPKYDYGYQILVLFGGLAIVGALNLWFLNRHGSHGKSEEPDDAGTVAVVERTPASNEG
ncbi:major facilitator superfamily domain-containing protein [Xylariomycetidae sp. FL2044]|nr:major facilitator superfamily domain-containing protein [Xylariomycetidae sp. FL2044]